MVEPVPQTAQRVLQASAESALFAGEIQGLVVTFHENERPLCGLAGLLDWRFQGKLSHHLRAGSIVGRVGECVYLPITRNQRTYHLILAGAGSSESPGNRGPVPEKTLEAVKRNLASLRMERMGVSRSDFGNISEEAVSGLLSGLPQGEAIWIVN